MRRIDRNETSQTCLHTAHHPPTISFHPSIRQRNIVPACVAGALVTYLDDSVVEETRSRSRYTHDKHSCTNAHAHSSENKLSTN
jgi:alpha-D-ribose 1-methylphosphonate 5-phosphate C-P lyase